jgi:DNA-directed RNA polymerase specialized sigma24 family protein
VVELRESAGNNFVWRRAEIPARLPAAICMHNPEADNQTGGGNGQFNTTHWSVVLLAGQQSSSQSAAALESLCRAYWQPIYVFARRQRHAEQDAKDLTQHFFCKLLERDDFSGLDPRKGKFRTFLLTAFTHFLANEYDRASAYKRGGGKIIVSLEELSREEIGLIDPATEPSAARGFDLQWSRLVVKQALESLKQEMAGSEKENQFERLKGFLAAEAGPGDYARAAQKLGVADSSVPVLVHRMRQRYRQLVRAQVAQTVTSPAELDEEMRHLFDVLNQ